MEELTAIDLLLVFVLLVPSVWILEGVGRGTVQALRFPASRPVEPLLWGPSEVFVLLCLWWAGQFVLVLFVGSILGVSAKPEELGKHGAMQLAVGVGTAALVLTWLVVTAKRWGQSFRSLGFVSVGGKAYWLALLTLAASVIPLQIGSGLWAALLSIWELDLTQQKVLQNFSELVVERDWTTVSCMAVNAVVVAPVIEEIMFRGVVFGVFRTRGGPWFAAVASSLLFAAVHFNLFAFGPLFLLSLVLSLLYHKSGSIYVAMFFHAVFNAGSLVATAYFST